MELTRAKRYIKEKSKLYYLQPTAITDEQLEEWLDEVKTDDPLWVDGLEEECLHQYERQLKEVRRQWVANENRTKTSTITKKKQELAKLEPSLTNNGVRSISKAHKLKKEITHITEVMNAWRKNEQPFSEFPFLKDKVKNKRVRALFLDLKTYLLKEAILSVQSTAVLIHYPKLFFGLSFSDTRITRTLDLFNTDKNVNELVTYELRAGEDKVLEVKELTNEIAENVLKRVLQALNETDLQVLGYSWTLTKKTKDRIAVPLKDLAHFIFPDAPRLRDYHYESIKGSLLKMGVTSYFLYDKNQIFVRTVRIMGSLNITKNEAGDEIALLRLSDELIEQLTKGQVINLYQSRVQALTNELAKVMIYQLERDRMVCCANQLDGTTKPMQMVYTLDDFCMYLFLSKANLTRTIRRIKELLDDLVANQLVIKSYTHKGREFLLTFLPYSKKEIRDLLLDEEPSEYFNKRLVDYHTELEGVQSSSPLPTQTKKE